MKRRTFVAGALSTLLLSLHPRTKALEAVKMNLDINQTGIVYDPIFLKHHIAAGHPETPDRRWFAHNTQRRGWGMGHLYALSNSAARLHNE